MKEQIFYVTFGESEPKPLTLTQLKALARVFIVPGNNFDEPIKIGTRWQGWPVDA